MTTMTDDEPHESVVLADRMVAAIDAALEAELVLDDAKGDAYQPARRRVQRAREKQGKAVAAWDAYWSARGVSLTTE